MTYSIIQKSQLEGAMRIDAEYYQPEYLIIEGKLKTLKAEKLVNLIERPVVTGSTPKVRDCRCDGTDIKFIKTDTVREGRIIFDTADLLPKEASRNNSKPKDGDILITIIGATAAIVGRAARVFSDDPIMNINQNIVLIRPKKLIRSGYLETFFRSKFGRNQLWQQSRQTEQVNLNCREVENVLVPLANEPFQDKIDKMVSQSHQIMTESSTIFSQAESLLLEELGLLDFEADHDLYSVVNIGEVQEADRMDADYFQAKYKNLTEKLKNAKKLGDITSIQKGVEPGSGAYQEEGRAFIRVSNLSKDGIKDNNQQYLSSDLYEKLRSEYQPKIEDILLTKDATPGIAYVLKEEIDGIISGGILRLKMKEKIEPEYLALCINSLVGKLQAERDAGGSIINHWRPDQIKEILIPILPKQTQEKIAGLVRKSHESRKKAKDLLEEAKRKVEELIEK